VFVFFPAPATTIKFREARALRAGKMTSIKWFSNFS
jgi:hypothetical protein